MKSAYQNNAVDTAPDLTQLTSDGYPTNGNSSLGIPATQPGAAWFHSVTSEIVNAITTLGGTPSSEEVNQLASALSTKFGTCVKSVNSNTPDSNGNVSLNYVPNAVYADNGVDSYGGNWIRFNCGLQICFGVATAGQNNAFGKAFKNGTIPDVNITHYTSNNMPYAATVQQGSGGTINNSTFYFLLWDLKDSHYVNYECHYIAIGFWK